MIPRVLNAPGRRRPPAPESLRSAKSVAAAALIVVEGDPTKDVAALRKVRLVIKVGAVVRGPS